MSVLVEKITGNQRGNWRVREHAGGPIVSKHRLKRVAVRKGKKLAKRKRTNVKIQKTNGDWTQGPSYR